MRALKKNLLFGSHIGLDGVLDDVNDLVHHGDFQAVSPANARLPRHEAADGHGLADLLTLYIEEILVYLSECHDTFTLKVRQGS